MTSIPLTLAEAVPLGTVLLQRLLDDAGVRSLVIKGPAFAQLGVRKPKHSNDIDLLVAPEDRTRATEALAQAGWSIISHWFPPALDDVIYSTTFRHVQFPSTLDLHHHFSGFFADDAFDALWCSRSCVAVAHHDVDSSTGCGSGPNGPGPRSERVRPRPDPTVRVRLCGSCSRRNLLAGRRARAGRSSAPPRRKSAPGRRRTVPFHRRQTRARSDDPLLTDNAVVRQWFTDLRSRRLPAQRQPRRHPGVRRPRADRRVSDAASGPVPARRSHACTELRGARGGRRITRRSRPRRLRRRQRVEPVADDPAVAAGRTPATGARRPRWWHRTRPTHQ